MYQGLTSVFRVGFIIYGSYHKVIIVIFNVRNYRSVSSEIGFFPFVSYSPHFGEEVVLVGRQKGTYGESSITIHDLATWANTIGYEIICGLSKRVPRTYFRKGKVETYKSLLGILPNHVTV